MNASDHTRKAIIQNNCMQKDDRKSVKTVGKRTKVTKCTS